MANIIEAFVAFDTSKLRNAVAIAEAGRAGEVRFLGEIENTEAAIVKLVRKLARISAWCHRRLRPGIRSSAAPSPRRATAGRAAFWWSAPGAISIRRGWERRNRKGWQRRREPFARSPGRRSAG